MIVVKVFKSPTEGAAILTTKDCSIRHAIVLDDILAGKMCRRDRAYFWATALPDGNVVLHKRLSDQKW